jgi:hypothetical protein
MRSMSSSMNAACSIASPPGKHRRPFAADPQRLQRSNPALAQQPLDQRLERVARDHVFTRIEAFDQACHMADRTGSADCFVPARCTVAARKMLDLRTRQRQRTLVA